MSQSASNWSGDLKPTISHSTFGNDTLVIQGILDQSVTTNNFFSGRQTTFKPFESSVQCQDSTC